MDINQKVQTVRRMCPIIFLLDTSGSMDGALIGKVNEAITGVIPDLITMNESNADNEIKVGIMAFDYNARWITGDELVSPEDLKASWNDLDANGLTAMGAAFSELNKKLSASHGFMNRASGSVAPVLFLLSDGEPTDDYQSNLNTLKQNPWYQVAARVAIGYGESNDDVLREFTGNKETVLHTDNPSDLKKMIRFVAITSSRVASSGTGMIPTDDTDNNNNPNPDDNTQKVAGALANADPNEVW